MSEESGACAEEEDAARGGIRKEDWERAVSVLGQMLEAQGGSVSSTALRRELDRKGIPEARQLVVKMRFFDFDGEPDSATPRPSFRFYHRGRSFFSEEAYQAAEAKTEAAAQVAGETAPGPEEEEVSVPRGSTDKRKLG
jgi:hypothetical protein